MDVLERKQRLNDAARILTRDKKLCLQVPGHAIAPRVVRSELAPLREVLGEDTHDKLELLLTEVITNALVHTQVAADDGLELMLELADDVLHVEVIDEGPGFDPVAHPERRLLDEGGRGLFLLDVLAERWGNRRNARHRVWFDLALS